MQFGDESKSVKLHFLNFDELLTVEKAKSKINELGYRPAAYWEWNSLLSAHYDKCFEVPSPTNFLGSYLVRFADLHKSDAERYYPFVFTMNYAVDGRESLWINYENHEPCTQVEFMPCEWFAVVEK